MPRFAIADVARSATDSGMGMVLSCDVRCNREAKVEEVERRRESVR